MGTEKDPMQAVVVLPRMRKQDCWVDDGAVNIYKDMMLYSESPQSLKSTMIAASKFNLSINPYELHQMTVFYKTFYCDEIVSSGLKFVLNAIQYLNHTREGKAKILKKLEPYTTDDGSAVETLLSRLDVSTLSVQGVPVGTAIFTMSPILTAYGNLATLFLLEPIIEHLMGEQTRSASRAFALKKIAPHTKLYLLSPDTQTSELTTVAVVHGGFHGGTCKSAELFHDVTHLELAMDPHNVRVLREFGDNITDEAIDIAMQSYEEIVGDLFPSKRMPPRDLKKTLTKLIADTLRTIQSQYVNVNEQESVTLLASVLLLLYKLKYCTFNIKVVADHVAVVTDFRKLFNRIRERYPSFPPVELLGLVSTDETLRETHHLFNKMLIPEPLIVSTPANKCTIVYEKSGKFMCNASKLYRFSDSGIDLFDLVCKKAERPLFISGVKMVVFDADGKEFVYYPTSCLLLTHEYNWKEPIPYSVQTVDAIQQCNRDMAISLVGILPVRYTRAALSLD